MGGLSVVEAPDSPFDGPSEAMRPPRAAGDWLIERPREETDPPEWPDRFPD